MPKTASERCRRCSKLSFEQAIAFHGPDGTGCWEGAPCHKRRSYYKNRDRYNKQRRKQYRVNQGAVPADAEVMSSAGESVTTQVIAVPVPQSVAAIVHLWRQNQSAPLHAIGFELLQNGKKTVEVEPVHTLGWTAIQVKQYMRDVLRSLSQHVEQEIAKFEARVEHDPETCAIEDCPLNVD